MPGVPAVNPWIIATGGHAGDVHGGARYLHCQCRAAAHRRQPVGWTGRKHLGSHLLSCIECHRSSAQRLAFFDRGPQEFLHGLRGLFTISSFLCGLAPNLAVLIICRILQGAGGGGYSRANRQFWPILSLPQNAAWPSRSTEWRLLPLLPLARLLADGSPTTSVGAGFSLSIFPSESFRCCLPRG